MGGHDPLTGLPDRQALARRLDRALARPPGSVRDETVAVVFCDLDGFKRINDGLGHGAGDEALLAAAGRIRAAVRPADLVARLGGDEFVVVCEGLRGQIEAMGIADRIRRTIEEPLTVAGQEVFLSASIGVAFASAASAAAGCDADGLIGDADAAMYRAKQRGKGRCEPYDRRMRQRAAARLATEADLRHALDAGRLELLLRPVVELESGRPAAVRARARWDRPGHGMVGPDRLGALAEEAGLAPAVDRWALGAALAAAAAGGAGGLPVVVRIHAGLLLRPGGVGELASALAESGVDPTRVWLEVPEAAFAPGGPDPSAPGGLRRLGVRVLVGGFGAGQASLAALRHPGVEGLTLDRGLVAGVLHDRPDRAIVAAVTRLAAELGLDVVAEGVDGKEQARVLAALGCRLGEGRLYPAQSVQSPVPTGVVDASLARTLASTGGEARA
ncbi:MAG TPA: EAL domain-containing protein [Acidimicrobiales bacterium]|nr:EAL domain-containing protein [Acidimicrobiales bacterium]